MPFEISGLQPISSWIELIRDRNSDFISKLRQIYGDNDDLKIEAARMCLCCLGEFAERYGADRNIIIIRSAGRYVSMESPSVFAPRWPLSVCERVT